MRHNADDSPYDYSSMEDAADAVLRSLEGRVLERTLVEVVDPEFNILHLVFSDQSFAIQGGVGGEVLQIVPRDTPPTEGRRSDITTVVTFPRSSPSPAGASRPPGASARPGTATASSSRSTASTTAL